MLFLLATNWAALGSLFIALIVGFSLALWSNSRWHRRLRAETAERDAKLFTTPPVDRSDELTRTP